VGSKFHSSRSQSIETNLTHKTHVMIDVFSCVKWTERKLNTNQLEIAQNEIWTPRKFPTIQYMIYSGQLKRKWLEWPHMHW